MNKKLFRKLAPYVLATALGTAGMNIVYSDSASTSHQVVITISPIRALYLDEQDNITQIYNNTPTITNDELQIFKNGVEISMTSEVRKQYNELLSTLNWNEPGVYQINLESEKIDNPSEENYSNLEKMRENLSDLEKMLADEISSEIILPLDKIYDAVSKVDLPANGKDYIIMTTVNGDSDGSNDISISIEEPY